jgi:hypothetical protein
MRQIRMTLALILLSAGLVSAQEIQVIKSPLVFRFLRTDSQQRSFRVEASPALPKLTVIPSDLVADSGVVILASNVNVASTQRETTRETFRVTVSGATRPGHYTGKLEVRPEQGAPKEVELDVTVMPAPAVEPELSSKSLSLSLQPPWSDVAFVGRPQVDGAAAAKLPLYLVQNAEGEAWVDSARVLAMVRADGGRLPDQAIRVASTTPLLVTGKDSSAVQVEAGGINLEPGEYTGTLALWVRDQDKPIQIPVKLRVKDGPLIAFALLVLGILAALLFTWWNADGKAKHDLVKALEVLAQDVREGGELQALERDAAMEGIAQAMQAIEAGAPAAQAQALYDQVKTFMAERRAAADMLLEEIKLLRYRLKSLSEEPGRTLRERLESQLEQAEGKVLRGEHARLEDAEDPLEALRSAVEDFASLVNRFKEVAPDKRDSVRQQMDAATTATELRQALRDGGLEVLAAARGLSYDMRAAAPETAASDRVRLSLKRRLQLSLGATAVALLTYLFVLAVGWISLYLKNDTFGADLMDYVPLFLWGATVEAVRGKTVGLTELKAITTQK